MIKRQRTKNMKNNLLFNFLVTNSIAFINHLLCYSLLLFETLFSLKFQFIKNYSVHLCLL